MKPETKYGLLTGAGVCLWTLAEYALGFHNTRFDIGEYSGYFSCIIPLALLVLLLRNRREATADGRLTLGQGVKSGLHASLVAGLVVWLFMLVYNRFINPGWMDLALDWKVAQLRLQGVAETAIREQIQFYHRMSSPLGCFGGIVLGSALTGAVFSLLLTLVLRRPRAFAPVSLSENRRQTPGP